MMGRSIARHIAIALTMMMLAAACGGGGDTELTPVGETAASDAAETADAIPTTAPIGFEEGEASSDDAVVSDTGGLTADNIENSIQSGDDVGLDPSTPWENIVLHVKDDVQLIPTFDAPNGNETTIYDVNTIDDVQLEYPLYAETVFGNRLALRVKDFDSTGNWAEVEIPVRPNGTTAWVQTAFFNEERHDYHITIDISTNTVSVFKGEEELLNQLAVSGRDSRPTPVVTSYIDEKIRGEGLSPAYGTWILSIAAFSESLGTFGGGGMPKLALHGTNQPDLMGQYISSGCVRVPNEIIDFIADTVPVGALVEIVSA